MGKYLYWPYLNSFVLLKHYHFYADEFFSLISLCVYVTYICKILFKSTSTFLQDEI